MIIRPASPADHPALVDLLRTTMGWPEGPAGHRLWRWKHVDSPFGPSVMWMAEEGGRPIGVRPFMRWEFERGSSWFVPLEPSIRPPIQIIRARVCSRR